MPLTLIKNSPAFLFYHTFSQENTVNFTDFSLLFPHKVILCKLKQSNVKQA